MRNIRFIELTRGNSLYSISSNRENLEKHIIRTSKMTQQGTLILSTGMKHRDKFQILWPDLTECEDSGFLPHRMLYTCRKKAIKAFKDGLLKKIEIAKRCIRDL